MGVRRRLGNVCRCATGRSWWIGMNREQLCRGFGLSSLPSRQNFSCNHWKLDSDILRISIHFLVEQDNFPPSAVHDIRTLALTTITSTSRKWHRHERSARVVTKKIQAPTPSARRRHTRARTIPRRPHNNPRGRHPSGQSASAGARAASLTGSGRTMTWPSRAM